MDHIIQFAVSVDDKRIKELAEAAAAKGLVEDFKKDYGSGYGYQKAWIGYIKRDVVDRLVAEFLEKSDDDLAEMVAGRLIRTSKFREKVSEKVSEKMAEGAAWGERRGA